MKCFHHKLKKNKKGCKIPNVLFQVIKKRSLQSFQKNNMQVSHRSKPASTMSNQENCPVTHPSFQLAEEMEDEAYAASVILQKAF